jgi:hypothetical protein
MTRVGLAALALAMAAPPALAQACRPAPELELRLGQAMTSPFIAEIKAETSAPGWNIGPWGGFEVAAPGLGEVIRLNGAMSQAVTACGYRLTWRLQWDGGRAVSADAFKVAPEAERSVPRASLKYSATAFRLTPDPASQTAWLTVTEGATSWNYLLNFPVTAISLLPSLHSDGLRLEMIGLRENGVLTYAEFSAAPTRR